MRRTVPDPDSSWRPSEAAERAAYEGTSRVHSPDELALHAKVSEALIDAPGLDLADIELEVDGSLVTLHGHVANVATIHELERRVAAIEGVTGIDNRLVVRASGHSR